MRFGVFLQQLQELSLLHGQTSFLFFIIVLILTFSNFLLYDWGLWRKLRSLPAFTRIKGGSSVFWHHFYTDLVVTNQYRMNSVANHLLQTKFLYSVSQVNYRQQIWLKFRANIYQHLRIVVNGLKKKTYKIVLFMHRGI